MHACRYGTTDMAALRQRVEEEKGDWLIYVVDAGQGSHFDLVFGAGRKAGILQDARPKRVEHVGFGLVLGQDGKRIRTRAGGPVRPLLLLPLNRWRTLGVTFWMSRIVLSVSSSVDHVPSGF